MTGGTIARTAMVERPEVRELHASAIFATFAARRRFAKRGRRTPLDCTKASIRLALLLGFAGCSLFAAVHAQDAPPRQIAPDLFAPTPRDAGAIAAPHPIARERIAPAPLDAPLGAPARAPIVMPTLERPVGACEPTARDWLICLAATAQLSDNAVEDTNARLIVGLDRRPRLNPVTRQAIAIALRGAQEVWRSLRERECADLALIETGLTATLYEARLVCRIRRDLERVEALSAHYGEEP